MALCMSIFLLAALLFPGCAKQTNNPAPTQTTQAPPTSPAPIAPVPTGPFSTVPSPTIPTPTVPHDPIPVVPNKPETPIVTPSGNTSSDDELRLIGAQIINEYYGITDLSCFEIDVDHYPNGKAAVNYELYIHGYPTNRDFRVRFDASGNVDDIQDYISEYLKYLPYATPEAVQKAVAQLQADPMVALRPNAPFYYSIDQEGYLCLGTEVIVPIDPPKPTEDGSPISGCGFDHQHTFPSVRVCNYE